MCACPTPSAGHGRSGVFISQMWAWASTMVRPAIMALAGCGSDVAASAAPAAAVVARTSRRDNMDFLPAWHSTDA